VKLLDRPAPPAPPNLSSQIADATAEAAKLSRAADELEAEFRAAVDAEDFERAQALKAEIPGARSSAALAEAHARALTAVNAEIQAAEAERVRAAQAEQRREQAHKQLARAQAAEREALDEIARRMASVEAGIEAVRDALQSAIGLEHTAGQARQDAYGALVELGEQPPNMRITRPNPASAVIDRNPLLREIFDLPGR
jgi:chromosome segregation ATPase